MDTSAAPAADDQPVDPKIEYSKWLDRCTSRREQFERGWWKRAESAQKMYDKPCGEDEAPLVPFNILYANTEILLPALYSATPRPDVAARYSGPTEPAKAVERLLTYLLDDNTPGSETFDNAMEGATLSGLVPGAGGVRVRHYPEDARPVRWEEFKYNQLVWGYAKKWTKVPWLAFLHPMRKEEVVREFKLTPEQAQTLKATDDEDMSSDSSDAREAVTNTLWVYELWIKAERRTIFLCAEYEALCLRDVINDPLKLAGFFPTPGLLTLVRKPSDVDPVPLFDYYRNQAEELNRVTVRLNKILAAIRVRGAYNRLLGTTLSNIFAEDQVENALVPSDTAMDPSSSSFENNIWFLPIDKLITVAQQLYLARQQILQVIYQITGLADIVRGASVASETATAQNLKSKWGNLRLKRMQRVVSVYARSLLRMAVDACTTVLPANEWGKITGLQLPMAAQKQEAIASFQQQAMLAETNGQQPPPPPPILQQPTWEEVVATLATDTVRGYIIDIETDSTVDNDAAGEKEEAIEFMGAFAQLLQGLGPLVQMGPTGTAAAKEITLAVAKRFKLGREVENSLRALQPPPPPTDDKAGDKAKSDMELQTLKLEGELAAKEHGFRLQEMERKSQLDQQKFDLEIQRLQLEKQRMMMQAMAPSPAAGARPPRR